jgi:hypothetical protein
MGNGGPHFDSLETMQNQLSTLKIRIKQAGDLSFFLQGFGSNAGRVERTFKKLTPNFCVRGLNSRGVLVG